MTTAHDSEDAARWRRTRAGIESRSEVFTLALKVDIVSGEILVNRLGEVMGDVFAAYGRDSAFNEGRLISSEKRRVKL
jgi:hypothetical protein